MSTLRSARKRILGRRCSPVRFHRELHSFQQIWNGIPLPILEKVRRDIYLQLQKTLSREFDQDSLEDIAKRDTELTRLLQDRQNELKVMEASNKGFMQAV